VTPPVRIVMLLVALAVIGLGAAVAVFADGGLRWLVSLVLIVGGLMCVVGAAEGTENKNGKETREA
jgi:energy-converting hydrogenase Eha subunit C